VIRPSARRDCAADPATDASEVGEAVLAERLRSPDRHLEGLLGLAGLESARGRLDQALRHADRARRLDPSDSTRAIIVARLCLRLGSPGAALRALGQASDRRDPGPLALARAEALIALGEAGAAAEALDDLLAGFAADAFPSLPELADSLCRGQAAGRPGWVGLATDGAVIGWLPQSEWPETGLALDAPATPGGEGAPGRFRAVLAPADRRTFAATLPKGTVGARSLESSPPWRLEGRVRRARAVVFGWATLGWAPQALVTVALTDRSGLEHRVQTVAAVGSDGRVRQTFSARLGAAESPGGLVAEAITPDSQRLELWGSPLKPPGGRRGPWRPGRAARPPAATPPAPPRLSVIVAVHPGLTRPLAGVNSVLAAADPADTDVIVVANAIGDSALNQALEALAVEGRVTLLRSAEPLGFATALRRGQGLHPGADVVVLNAEAAIFGDGLARLRRAAYAAPDIATATPVSNHGSLLAYASGEGGEIDEARGVELDVLLGDMNPGHVLDLPRAGEVCVYIRCDALSRARLFADTIPRRGEDDETDFRHRATAAGWRHVGAADVFVGWLGRPDANPLATALADHDRRLLEHRHPALERTLRRFQAEDPFRPVRRAADEARLAADPVRTALLMTHARGGGVARHVAGRASALAAEGLRVIELRPGRHMDAGGACRLAVRGWALNDLVFVLPAEGERLIALLSRLKIERIEIHHTLGLDPSVLDLPRRLDAPAYVYGHDYSLICPRVTLISGDGRYCGEPDVAACERCVARHGSLIEESLSVADLRARAVRVLSAAAGVIVPTRDAAKRLNRYAPRVPILVEPWESPPSQAMAPPLRARGAGEPIRVLVVGAIGEHKGFARLLACARDAEARDLPLSFVVVGHTEDDAALFATGRVFITGRYQDDEVGDLIAREACDVALLPSVWPETWCYALTALLASGLPIIAYDLGAMAERLGDVARARLMPLDSDAATLNEALAAAVPPRVLIGVRARGEALTGLDGESWAHLPGGETWIEGVSMGLAGADAPGEIQYRAILAGGAEGAWTSDGGWCDDPSGLRPLIGFSVKLAGHLARTQRCDYAGLFSSGSTAAAADGEPCLSPMQNDPLVALSVSVSPS
jgi:glycosyltransferase involved in cell wall biosynthesis